MKKWTIIFIGYNSLPYIAEQLRYFYENNNPEDFNVLFYDNTVPHETELDNIFAAYEKHNNFKIVYFDAQPNYDYNENKNFENSKDLDVDQHGEAMNAAISEANSKYVLIQDPDFFWLRPNVLQYLEEKFGQGYRTVGAPYPQKMGYGQPDFPALFGCAHHLEDLKKIDCRAAFMIKSIRDEAEALYPARKGWAPISTDVGWRVRKELSDNKYLAFTQQFVLELIWRLGQYTTTGVCPMLYSDDKGMVALHMFGGARNVEQTFDFINLTPEKCVETNLLWKERRKQYAEFLLAKDSVNKLQNLMSFAKPYYKRVKLLSHFILSKKRRKKFRGVAIRQYRSFGALLKLVAQSWRGRISD